MSVSNPFVARFDAHGWKLAGDHWAKIALSAADRARACWAHAATCVEEFEASVRAFDAELEQSRLDLAEEWKVEAPRE
jgi:hypothetical protein